MSSTTGEQRADPKTGQKHWRWFFGLFDLARKWQKTAKDSDEQELDDEALERYRALDTLASAVFQTGLAIFIGGVAIGVSVESSFFRVLIICASFPPLSCACVAGLAMLSIGHRDPENPTIKNLHEKRKSVENSTFWLVVSIMLPVCLIIVLLSFTNNLS